MPLRSWRGGRRRTTSSRRSATFTSSTCARIQMAYPGTAGPGTLRRARPFSTRRVGASCLPSTARSADGSSWAGTSSRGTPRSPPGRCVRLPRSPGYWTSPCWQVRSTLTGMPSRAALPPARPTRRPQCPQYPQRRRRGGAHGAARVLRRPAHRRWRDRLTLAAPHPAQATRARDCGAWRKGICGPRRKATRRKVTRHPGQRHPGQRHPDSEYPWHRAETAGPAGWTWHLDVQFVAISPPGARPVCGDESDDLRWWPVDSLPSSADEAVRRLVARACALSR